MGYQSKDLKDFIKKKYNQGDGLLREHLPG
jgi:hypothetical protein